MSEIDKFKQSIVSAQRVLITSHISPDPDAVSSTLLLGATLRANHPNKQIEMILEEAPTRDLSFLTGYDQIKFAPLLETAKELKPDLFVMVDAMNYERVSRSDGAKLRTFVEDQLKAKTAIIDHHTETSKDDADIYLNRQMPATAQEIYNLLFKDQNLKKPDGWAEATLLGIITDTSRFLYDNPRYRETFDLVSELLDAGASIEAIENKLDRYSLTQMQIFAILAKNATDSGKGYTYTYIDWSDAAEFEQDKAGFKAACELFTNQFIRSIGDNLWGFIVYPEMVDGKKAYSASFRAVSGHRDVAAIAGKLGGGGHKAAAGTKGVEADSAREAIQKIEAVIEG